MAREYILHRHSAPAGPRIDYAAELNEQQCAAVTAQPATAQSQTTTQQTALRV